MVGKEEYIRLLNGKILGSIEEMSNGDKIARDFPGHRILGYYRKAINQTTDPYGRILTMGDTVISLIYNGDEK